MRELDYKQEFGSQVVKSMGLFKDLLIDNIFLEYVDAAAKAVVDTIHNGGRIYVCGNGGSACEAQHFVGELVGRFSMERESLPAVALNADGGILTCIGNDYGFDNVFARQVEGLCMPNDLLVVLSTSGDSPNIVNALRTAERIGVDSIALLGKTGGEAFEEAFIPIVVPHEDTDKIQEVHLMLIHYFCHMIDNLLDEE